MGNDFEIEVDKLDRLFGRVLRLADNQGKWDQYLKRACQCFNEFDYYILLTELGDENPFKGGQK